MNTIRISHSDLSPQGGMVGALAGGVAVTGESLIEVDLSDATGGDLAVLLPIAAQAYVEAFVPQGIIESYLGGDLPAEGFTGFAEGEFVEATGPGPFITDETRQFRFNTYENDHDLTLSEVIGQAVGAASVSWHGGTGNAVFDDRYAATIVQALQFDVESRIESARQQGYDAGVSSVTAPGNVRQHITDILAGVVLSRADAAKISDAVTEAVIRRPETDAEHQGDLDDLLDQF